MIRASYGLRLFDIGQRLDFCGVDKTSQPGSANFNFVMVPVSKVRFTGILGGVDVTVDFENSGTSHEDALTFATRCAAALRDELAPSAQQLQDTERAVNDAIAAEAARLERVTAETNQAYGHVCNQLALAYDRIADLELKLAQLVVTLEPEIADIRQFGTLLLNGFEERTSRLNACQVATARSVDTLVAMVNSFSRFQTGADSVLLSIQKRLADLETPKPAAKSRAKKAATKKVVRASRKKRGA